jgi:hypothetical protein
MSIEKRKMRYDHAVACQCGLDAAVVLQWIEDRQGRFEGGLVPRSELDQLHIDVPYISRTMVKRIVMTLRAAMLLDAEFHYLGREGDRLRYRAAGVGGGNAGWGASMVQAVAA